MGNLTNLRRAMNERGIAAFLVSDPTNVSWTTGFSGSFGYAIVTPKNALFITDSRYTIQADEQVKEMPKASFAQPVEGNTFLAEQITKMGIGRLGFESSTVTHSTYKVWAEKLPGVELVGVDDMFNALRLVKAPEEVAAIREACGVTDACFAHVCRMIQPGVSEFDIALELEFYIRRNGADLAFTPGIASGERSAMPHGHATEKKLEVGDFFTLDFGAKVDGYCADMTRTVVVSHAGDRHSEVYEQVLKAEMAAIAAMKPGVLAKDVDAIARKVLDEKGLARYFGHGLGHGLGKVVHDYGRLSVTSTDVLEVGQVWTVEPGVYIPGFGGVRIEDDVVVTKDGVDILTHSPKELLVLP